MTVLFLITGMTVLLDLVSQSQQKKSASLVVKTTNGQLEGTTEEEGLRTFKGIPFAAPPVGDLRWKEPQPVKNWQGIRKADTFGPRPMQRALFGDMSFRSSGMSEDCLYLNVWTPAKSANEKLPVLVYFYGGGLMTGDGSEPRYDGASMARKGIVTLTVNYRVTIFGFFAHPELTKESPHHSASNYGYFDQTAALRWVQQNIAAFGGDPERVTIAGESAGSISVSAQMASPLAKGLFAGVIGESGSLLGTLPPTSLAKAEKIGVKFATGVGATSLVDLRTMPAEKILEATAKSGLSSFPAAVDGYFFPQKPLAIFEAGQQAHVPLLVGWNSEEMNACTVMGQEKMTPEGYAKALQKLYPEKSAEALKAYSAASEEDIQRAATDLASDRFTGYSTWKWSDLQSKTGNRPVYRYYYSHPRPAMNASIGNATAGLAGGVIIGGAGPATPQPLACGAVHSAEIEYAMGNLASNEVYDWTPDDYKVSKVMQEYFANFIKTGNPNGPGVPVWSAINDGGAPKVMHIDVNTRLEPETNRNRYLFLDSFYTKP